MKELLFGHKKLIIGLPIPEKEGLCSKSDVILHIWSLIWYDFN